MHMPKCGGTSISEAMYATVPLGRGVSVIDAVSTRRAAAILAFGTDDPRRCHEDLPDARHVFALRESLLLTHMAWGSRLIHGHFLYSARAEAAFGDRYRHVTLLREPEARMISNFRMAVRSGLVAPDLDGYLETPIAVNHASVFLRYLSGECEVTAAPDRALVDLAKARLGRFAVVGFLDDLPGFARAYRDVFGVGLRIHAYNQGDGAPPDLTADQKRRVAALCAADREIYDSARASGRAA